MFSGSPRDAMDNVLNWDIVESEFKLQSRNDFYFLINALTKGMNPLISCPVGGGLEYIDCFSTEG